MLYEKCSNVKLKFLYGGSDDIEKDIFICTPVGPRENSLVYLGHGRIGHLPDYGYQEYKCSKHTGEPMKKNNPSDFRNAFVQMIHVMLCIKKKMDKEDDFKNAVNFIEDEKLKQMEDVLGILTKKETTGRICELFRKYEENDAGLPKFSQEVIHR